MKIQICGLLTLVIVWLPKGSPWILPAMITQVACLVWMTHGFIAEGKELKRKRERELQKQHIRELEKELGFTPLELGDPTRATEERP